MAELSHLLGMATRQRVKDLLNLEIRKIETELIRISEQTKPSDAPKTAPSSQRCYDVKLTNYAWDQSDKVLKLFITLKNVHSLAADQVSCTFTKRTVEFSVKGLDNRNYFLTINNLLKDIDESKSHWKVKSDMVIVYLTKSESVKWSHLTVSESKLKDAQSKALTDEMESNEDPSQGLMSLMKKMYNEGDDEMKRTIAKAWTEGRDKNTSALDY